MRVLLSLFLATILLLKFVEAEEEYTAPYCTDGSRLICPKRPLCMCVSGTIVFPPEVRCRRGLDYDFYRNMCVRKRRGERGVWHH